MDLIKFRKFAGVNDATLIACLRCSDVVDKCVPICTVNGIPQWGNRNSPKYAALYHAAHVHHTMFIAFV